jgi:carbon-monoxide dehydrogenase small subunit
MPYSVSVLVNGRQVTLDVPVEMTLADMLRDRLGLMGTKVGCGQGECGACTVLFDDLAVNACLILAITSHGHRVVTIEGVSGERELDPVQQAFIQSCAVQCGYCTPGMVLAAKGLLAKEPNPSRESIRVALSGNLCRCTGYTAILDAVERAAAIMGEAGEDEGSVRP